MNDLHGCQFLRTRIGGKEGRISRLIYFIYRLCILLCDSQFFSHSIPTAARLGHAFEIRCVGVEGATLARRSNAAAAATLCVCGAGILWEGVCVDGRVLGVGASAAVTVWIIASIPISRGRNSAKIVRRLCDGAGRVGYFVILGHGERDAGARVV